MPKWEIKSDYNKWLITLTMITLGPVTKIKNIKTESIKILRLTHFSGAKYINTNKFFFGLIPRIFFLIGVDGLNIYIEAFLENKTKPLRPTK
jgi:hypothetical protein